MQGVTATIARRMVLLTSLNAFAVALSAR